MSREIPDQASPSDMENGLSKDVEIDSSMKSKGTLIARQWRTVLPGCTLTYIILQLIISYQNNICVSKDPFAHWTYEVGIAVLSCYALAVIYHVISAFSTQSWAKREMEHLRGVYAGAVSTSHSHIVRLLLNFPNITSQLNKPLWNRLL
jgi:hypothetical protein